MENTIMLKAIQKRWLKRYCKNHSISLNFKSLEGIIYLLRTGCQWRLLPPQFSSWQSIYHLYRSWSVQPWFRRMMHRVLHERRKQNKRKSHPSVAGLITIASAPRWPFCPCSSVMWLATRPLRSNKTSQRLTASPLTFLVKQALRVHSITNVKLRLVNFGVLALNFLGLALRGGGGEAFVEQVGELVVFQSPARRYQQIGRRLADKAVYSYVGA